MIVTPRGSWMLYGRRWHNGNPTFYKYREWRHPTEKIIFRSLFQMILQERFFSVFSVGNTVGFSTGYFRKRGNKQCNTRYVRLYTIDEVTIFALESWWWWWQCYRRYYFKHYWFISSAATYGHPNLSQSPEPARARTTASACTSCSTASDCLSSQHREKAFCYGAIQAL